MQIKKRFHFKYGKMSVKMRYSVTKNCRIALSFSQNSANFEKKKKRKRNSSIKVVKKSAERFDKD